AIVKQCQGSDTAMLPFPIYYRSWLASVCLFYRNWLVALISLTRYRLFSRHSGGGGGGGGGRCRGSVLSHRARAERSSLRQFRLASCLLLGNAGLFCTFLSLKTVGELCDSQSWLSAPVTVDRFLLAVNNASLFWLSILEWCFRYSCPAPRHRPGFLSAVLITLWRHMNGGSSGGASQQSIRNNRKRFRRPFIAFMAMNIALNPRGTSREAKKQKQKKKKPKRTACPWSSVGLGTVCKILSIDELESIASFIAGRLLNYSEVAGLLLQSANKRPPLSYPCLGVKSLLSG
uniref:G_PROTEIN_RECEP_F1_2 domain-containing protein n=1 Tax=Macrostomum lignano TaxID=282301 RepID=A0A1I8F6N1_9PLAT